MAIALGSRLDPPDAPGASRVLASILEQGGYRSVSQDYASLVARRGGSSQATVGAETTTYCTTLPASEFPLAVWVTAGRMTSAALTEEELVQARETVAQGAEQVDAEVISGRAPARLRQMAFLGSEAYARSLWPHPDDVQQLSLLQLRQLHRDYYVASRAALAISGGFELSLARKEVEKQLGSLRKGARLDAEKVSLVRQTTERFSMAEDHTTKTPAAWYGWVAPSGADIEAMEAALGILAGESRLQKTLVGGSRAAKYLRFHPAETGPGTAHGLSRLEILGSNSRSLGTIEKSFGAELRKLATQGPSEDEVGRFLQARRDRLADALKTPQGRALALAQGSLAGREPKSVLLPLQPHAELPGLSAERVAAAASELLSPWLRSTVEVYPKGWQDPWQAPMPLFHIVEKGHTLGSIAQRYGTSVAVITKMNGISAAKPIYPGDKLKVPRGKVKKERPLRTHQVRRGDTVSGLAVRYGVSSRGIADANGMGSKLIIRTGETLRIPWGKKSAPTSSPQSSATGAAGASHKVVAGETLSGIAHQHGVSTVALARANGISHRAMVRIGQKLKVPPRGTGKTSAAPPQIIEYTVKKGDTLSAIAARHGVTVAALTVANQMSRKSTLRPGQKLKIPQKKK